MITSFIKENVILLFVFLLIFIIPFSSSAGENNYKKMMKSFVIEISKYSKTKKKNFIIISQNAPELMGINRNREDKKYLNAIDGIGIEGLNFGFNNSRIAKMEYLYKMNYLKFAAKYKKKILIIEYSKRRNRIRGLKRKFNYDYVTYHAPNRELDKIPDEKRGKINKKSITKLSQVRNFLYLINPQRYSSKRKFLKKLKDNYYDLLIIDNFFYETMLTKKDIKQLKYKKNGERRLVISYLSIGEAEDYRYYWKRRWSRKKPEWIERENPKWRGNYVVRYWYKSWEKIIFGNKNSYLDKIIKNDFDGVYLDTLDSWEYFQNNHNFY